MASQHLNGEGGPQRVNGLNMAQYFLFFLLFLVLYGCFTIIKPYIHTIVLAAILAVIFKPIHRRIERAMKGRRNFAALLSCLLLTLLVVLPLTFVVIALIQQGIHSFYAISNWIDAGNLQKLLQHPYVAKAAAYLQQVLPDAQKLSSSLDIKQIKFDKELLNVSSAIGKTLINQGGQLLGNLSEIIGKFLLMIFVFFFVVRDGETILASLLHLLPLSASHERQMMAKISSVSRSALLGTFLTAAAQGAAGGIAFWAAGLPGLFWGVMMAFASLIPLVGTALIWMPAAVYLFIAGRGFAALFLALWCGVIVGLIDNFLRPMFMKGAADMGTFVIFFSILGGVSYFGLIGLLYGPLLFGLAVVLLYIYSLEFETFLDAQDKA